MMPWITVRSCSGHWGITVASMRPRHDAVDHWPSTGHIHSGRTAASMRPRHDAVDHSTPENALGATFEGAECECSDTMS